MSMVNRSVVRAVVVMQFCEKGIVSVSSALSKAKK